MDEEAVRQRAHRIWLREGMPEGKADEHWQRAQRELACANLAASATRLAVTAALVPAYFMLRVLSRFTPRP